MPMLTTDQFLEEARFRMMEAGHRTGGGIADAAAFEVWHAIVHHIGRGRLSDPQVLTQHLADFRKRLDDQTDLIWWRGTRPEDAAEPLAFIEQQRIVLDEVEAVVGRELAHPGIHARERKAAARKDGWLSRLFG